MSSYKKGSIPSFLDMSDFCCGLVVHDDKTGILRFSHATVHEFLERISNETRHEGEAWIAGVPSTQHSLGFRTIVYFLFNHPVRRTAF